MKSKKFVEADLASTKPGSAFERQAFGSVDSDRNRFGRESSPHFGGLPPLGKDERGVAMIEYAMLCGAVALAILAAMVLLGGGVGRNWNDVDTAVGESTQFKT